MSNVLRLAATPLAPVALLLAATGAGAENSRIHSWSATSVCEAPLPVYDATLRKRPLGITNEGTATIHISCSLPGDHRANTDDAWVYVYFTSTGPAATASCTMAAGNRYTGAFYETKSVAVGAGASTLIQFEDVNRGTAFGSLNFSCNLPPGIELNMLLGYQFDDQGEL